jgi:hypothetical protein
MKIQSWEYRDVSATGILADERGAVAVKPGAKWNNECAATRSTLNDGLFLCVNAGRDSQGTVRGITIYFDSRRELAKFLSRACSPYVIAEEEASAG